MMRGRKNLFLKFIFITSDALYTPCTKTYKKIKRDSVRLIDWRAIRVCNFLLIFSHISLSRWCCFTLVYKLSTLVHHHDRLNKRWNEYVGEHPTDLIYWKYFLLISLTRMSASPIGPTMANHYETPTSTSSQSPTMPYSWRSTMSAERTRARTSCSQRPTQAITVTKHSNSSLMIKQMERAAVQYHQSFYDACKTSRWRLERIRDCWWSWEALQTLKWIGFAMSGGWLKTSG